MRPLLTLLPAIAIATALGIGAVAPASAGVYTANANAQIGLGNLAIQFTDPNAVMTWASSWLAETGAGAADVPGSIDEVYGGFLGDDEFNVVEAKTNWATGSASAAVTAGTDIDSETSASASVTGKYRLATAFGNATLDNFFSIAGGNAGDPVTMTVTLDYTGVLSADADRGGDWSVAAYAFISLYGADSLTGQYDDLLNFAEFADATTGTDGSVARNLGDALTFTQELRFGEVYWLYAEADSEATAAVPVPGSLPLLLLGSVLLGWRRRRI